MLEKPDLSDKSLEDSLKRDYDLDVRELDFLPIGNDVNTAVYRVVTHAGQRLFLKLRRDDFNEASILIPKLLHDLGVKQVIAPLLTKSQELWTTAEAYKAALFPFIEGKNGFQQALSDQQWIELGTVLRALHSTQIPFGIEQQLPHETYAAKRREMVKTLLHRVNHDMFGEPTAAKLAQFIKSKQDVIEDLIEKATQLSTKLEREGLPLVLCHSDIHAANVLIDARGGFYMLDWDTLVLAPKERDLMFIGGGVGGAWNKPEEAQWFYAGYGQTQISPTALAYYRYERIVEDVAEYCSRILLTDAGGADREKGLSKFRAAFLPNNVVEIAMKHDLDSH